MIKWLKNNKPTRQLQTLQLWNQLTTNITLWHHLQLLVPHNQHWVWQWQLESKWQTIAKVSEVGLDKASDICVLVAALTFTAWSSKIRIPSLDFSFLVYKTKDLNYGISKVLPNSKTGWPQNTSVTDYSCPQKIHMLNPNLLWEWLGLDEVMRVKSESEVAQPCPTFRNPMDCSRPGPSIHGIFQARVQEWGAIAFSHSQVCNPNLGIVLL